MVEHLTLIPPTPIQFTYSPPSYRRRRDDGEDTDTGEVIKGKNNSEDADIMEDLSSKFLFSWIKLFHSFIHWLITDQNGNGYGGTDLLTLKGVEDNLSPNPNSGNSEKENENQENEAIVDESPNHNLSNDSDSSKTGEGRSKNKVNDQNQTPYN